MPERIKKNSDATILIVDDQIENLQILGNILNINKYRKAVANNGYEALDIAFKKPPDLILLDVMMPVIDGFEVCRRLKSNPLTSEIPVIFLTAKTQTEDIIKGFEVGGVDYITKPFKHEELLARIRTHVELKRSKDIILDQNERLKQLNAEKSEFMSIAAHDLKNPLQVMVGFSKILEQNSGDFTPEEVKEFAGDIRESGETMFKIITDLLDINAIEEGRVEFSNDEFDICDLIDRMVDLYRIKADEKSIQIEINHESPENRIFADPTRVSQILDNLISNAVKFSPFKKKIFIGSSRSRAEGTDNDIIRIEIQDQGPGISKEDKDKLFIKFAKLKARPTNNESSTRLGLSIVKNFTERMNGRVWCESEEGEGARFIIELPAKS